LDVGVLDEGLASQLEGLFLADMASSVEITLPRTRPYPAVLGEAEIRKASLDPEGTLPERLEQQLRTLGTGRRMRMAPLVRAGAALGDALAGDRTLGREDRTVLGTLSIAILSLAIVAGIFPTLIGWIVAVVASWFGIVTGVRASMQARRARIEERSEEAYRASADEQSENIE